MPSPPAHGALRNRAQPHEEPGHIGVWPARTLRTQAFTGAAALLLGGALVVRECSTSGWGA
jgi:hypothetical protein